MHLTGAADTLTFLGHASFHLRTAAGTGVLIDPWVDGNPELAPAWQAPPPAHAVLVTHGHEDHFDPALITAQLTQGARLLCPTPVRRYLNTLGIHGGLEPINVGGSVALADLTVTMTPALHHAHIETPQGPAWPHESAGFVVRTPGSCVYFAGDTSLFGDLSLIADVYRPQVAALPIGDRYTMGPLEAAHAARLLRVQHVVPFHYSLMPTLTGTPDALRAHLRELHLDVRVHDLAPGGTLNLAALTGVPA